MEYQFVPYELAVKLKELGFDEKCEATWRQNTEREWYDPRKGEEIVIGNTNIFLRTYIYLGKDDTVELCIAPLWQQAFDWFRKKGLSSHIEDCGIYGYYYKIDNELYGNSKENCGFDYDTAKIECIKTLINIYEYEQTTKNS